MERTLSLIEKMNLFTQEKREENLIRFLVDFDFNEDVSSLRLIRFDTETPDTPFQGTSNHMVTHHFQLNGEDVAIAVLNAHSQISEDVYWSGSVDVVLDEYGALTVEENENANDIPETAQIVVRFLNLINYSDYYNETLLTESMARRKAENLRKLNTQNA